MILLFFFFFIIRWVATCPIFHLFLFFVFRSPVNEENQDGVMHVDGKGQKDVYVVLQAHKSSLIILRESWMGYLSSQIYVRPLSFLYICLFLFIFMMHSLSSFPLTRDTYSNVFKVYVSVCTYYLCTVCICICISIFTHSIL